MCRKFQLWSIVLFALGVGFILSSLFSGIFVRIIIGACLIAIAIILNHQG